MCRMDVSLQMASGFDANTMATTDLLNSNFLLITGTRAHEFDGSYFIHQVNLACSWCSCLYLHEQATVTA